MKRFCMLLTAAILVALQAAAVGKSTTVVFINGAKYYVHTVAAGDTLYALAKTYGVTEQQIIDSNSGLNAATLKIDQTVKIPFVDEQKRPMTKKEKRRFKIHTVKAQETLYSIARRYEVAVKTIIEDNPDVDPTALPIGYELMIRKSEIGDTPAHKVDSQWNDYKETLNRTAPLDSTAYHIVQPGETIYSLARRFAMTEQEFIALNDLSDGLKAGAIVRVAAPADDKRMLPDVPQTEQDTLATSDNRTEMSRPREFRTLSRSQRLDIALLLPIRTQNKVNENYVDFYKGFLMGLDRMKREEGIDASLTLFNTAHDAAVIRDIVDYDEGLRNADLIVGPVYEDELDYVLQYAERNDTPVVSPLSTIDQRRSPVLFQMQAAARHKYDKFGGMFDGSRQIRLIYAASNDREFASEITELLGDTPHESYNFAFNRTPALHRRNADGSSGALVDINAMIRDKADKVFVIMADKETDIDRILTTFSSARTSITDRGFVAGDYIVLGNRKWTRLGNIDHKVFFKNNVVFAVPYHAKRSDEQIRSFDGQYIKEFGSLPSMFSYRGYDAAVIFCRAMYEGLGEGMEPLTTVPLKTPYRFEFEDGMYVNTVWTKEHYRNNFTITTE